MGWFAWQAQGDSTIHVGFSELLRLLPTRTCFCDFGCTWCKSTVASALECLYCW